MTKRTVTALLFCAAVAVLVATGIVWAQTSSNYDNQWHVLSAGGREGMTSETYRSHGTTGQFAIGPAASSNYQANSGYWYGIQAAAECEPITWVDFDWLPVTPQTGETVTFTASYQPLTATTPISFEWSFGDGGGGSGNPVYHTYTTSDTYSVSLTGTNPCGGPVWMTHDVVVTGQPFTPTYDVELTPETDSASGAPGDTVLYRLTLHNTGDTADSVDLAYTDLNGWTSSVAPASVSLAPDATAPVTLTVDIPVGASDGDYDVASLSATSQGDPSVSDRSTLTTTAVVTQVCEPVTGVDFTWLPINPQTGETVTFTASYQPLTATTPISFEWSFGDGGGGSGNPVYHTYTTSDTYSVSLTGTNPCGGPVWMTHDVVVTGQPFTPTYDVELTPETDSASGAPGDTVLYRLTLHNTGDTADSVDLAYTDLNGWTSSVAPASVSLAPDATAPVTLTVDIPVGASDGDYDVASLSATSQGDPSVSDRSTLTTTAAVTQVCEPVTGVELSLITSGTLYVGSQANIQADIAPNDATKPYTYTIDYGDGSAPVEGTSSDDPYEFSYTYTNTGAYTLEFWAWNCDMSVPMTDSIEITVKEAMYMIYLPIVVKNN